MSSSPSHDEMLTDPILGMSFVSNHTYGKFESATSLSYPEELFLEHTSHSPTLLSFCDVLWVYTDDFLHGPKDGTFLMLVWKTLYGLRLTPQCQVSYLTFKFLDSFEGPERGCQEKWHPQPCLTTWVLLLGPTWWHWGRRESIPASCPLASTNIL